MIDLASHARPSFSAAGHRDRPELERPARHRPAAQHRRRLDDRRADPRGTRPDHLGGRVGARRQLVQPAPRRPRQARRPRRARAQRSSPARRSRSSTSSGTSARPSDHRACKEEHAMVDVCDVPVISGVCDVAGEAAGEPGDRAVRLARRGDGQRGRMDVRVGVGGLRLDHDGRRHQRPVHEGLQHPVRRRGLRHARLLHAPGHRRDGPPRTRRVDPRRPSAWRSRSSGRSSRSRCWRSLWRSPTSSASGSSTPRAPTWSEMGDRIALLAAGLGGINVAAPGAGAIVTIFLAGAGDRCGRHRVDQPARSARPCCWLPSSSLRSRSPGRAGTRLAAGSASGRSS